MKFFQKPSPPLFIIGIGILIFVLALTAVYAVTGKTDSELIDGFLQRVYLISDKPQTVFSSPGNKINLVYVGPRSAGGFIDPAPLTVTLFDPQANHTIVLSERTSTSPWKDIPFNSKTKLRESLIEISENIPADLQTGAEMQLKLKGKIDYPLLMHDGEAYSKIKNVDHSASLQIVSKEDMLRIVRKRPNMIMAVGFPVSLLLIAWGLKTELYNKRKAEKSAK